VVTGFHALIIPHLYACAIIRSPPISAIDRDCAIAYNDTMIL
jgi:hypothetical protein